jgi:hypothetical protein
VTHSKLYADAGGRALYVGALVTTPSGMKGRVIQILPWQRNIRGLASVLIERIGRASWFLCSELALDVEAIENRPRTFEDSNNEIDSEVCWLNSHSSLR